MQVALKLLSSLPAMGRLFALAGLGAVLALVSFYLASPPDTHAATRGLSELDSYAICASSASRISTLPTSLWKRARIYTGDVDPPTGAAVSIQCFAVDGETKKIALTGSEEQVSAWCDNQTAAGSSCQVRSLQPGHVVLPGLHDAHGHILDLGWSRGAADLVGATSIREIIKRLEQYVESRADLLENESKWVEGLGWDQTKWDPAVFPTAADVVASSPLLASRRIALRRIDVHALWLSPKAMAALEEAKVLPPNGTDVEGGLIIRDEHGKPTGCLIDKAMDFAYKVIPKWTDEDRNRFLAMAADSLLSVGITSVGDAAVDIASLDYMRSLDREGKLPLRIYGMLACPPGQPRCADLAASQDYPLLPTPESRLTVRTVKLFADGALGSWGSALWEPYSDRPAERGLMLIPEDDIEPLIRYWADRGWQVATHCIGDRANTLVLDAYQSILSDSTRRTGQLSLQSQQQQQQQQQQKDERFRIEHAQIVRTADIVRFGHLGVIPSVQPTHCTSDMAYVESRLGHSRSEGAYVWSGFLQGNGSAPYTLALGSDFPVELPNPFHGFYSAVTRMDPQGSSPWGKDKAWFGKQRLTRAQALRGFTLAPAYAQFEEHVGGSLAAGKRADFVLVDRDVMDTDKTTAGQMREAVILATFIDGRAVWQK